MEAFESNVDGNTNIFALVSTLIYNTNDSSIYLTFWNLSPLGNDHAEWLFLNVLDDIVCENPPEYMLNAASALYINLVKSLVKYYRFLSA